MKKIERSKREKKNGRAMKKKTKESKQLGDNSRRMKIEKKKYKKTSSIDKHAHGLWTMVNEIVHWRPEKEIKGISSLHFSLEIWSMQLEHWCLLFGG